MAEDAVRSYGNSEDLNIGLSYTNGSVTHFQYHSQWMGRWKRASSISAHQCHKHCTLSDASNRKNCVKQEGYSQVENTKSDKVQLVSIGTREGTTPESRNVCSSDLNELGLTLHVHRSAEFVGAEKGRCEMNNTLVPKDVHTYDGVVVSDKLQLHKFSDSSINWENHNTCHSLNSDETHSPKYDISWKIDSILNPKRGPGHGQVASRFARLHLPLKGTTLGSHVTDSKAKEISTSSDQEIESCDTVKGLQHVQDGISASTSQPAMVRSKAERPNMKSPVCIKNRRMSSVSDHTLDGHRVRSSFTNLNHELRNFSGHSRAMVSEMKGDNQIANVRSPWSRTKCGSMQVLRDLWPGKSPLSYVIRENDTENVLHQPLNYMSNCFIHNVLDIHNYLHPVNNIDGDAQNPFNAVHYQLTTKNMSMELSREKQLIEDSTETAKAKVTPLFEMLTVPATARNQGMWQGDSQPLINSNSMENGVDVNGIEMHMMGKRERPSAKIDAIHIEACLEKNSPKGMISDRLQKDLLHTKLIKSHSPSASAIQETLSRYVNSSDKTGSVSTRGQSTSRTESMNVDQVFSHVQRSKISNTSSIIENLAQMEQCKRWLKRLRHKSSDAFGLGSKRTKIGYHPTNAEVCSFLSKAHNYDTSSSAMTKCPKEQQIPDATKDIPSPSECSYGVSARDVQYWIKRWCYKTPQTVEAHVSLVTPGLCKPENRKVLPDNIEGKQFPSIRAMALMGRAMNKFRTGQFQRKGSSVFDSNLGEGDHI
ncbi:hypothetical protein MUK42_13377 [Musa troglodytarum]|uniref:Uncharacterized protein n=1 Tax=Musa troglodytarum TaxID=320322 RepID=A0A9E7KHY9_9LILI|nr:hypothetical protein MUK42_13377 [Musa troglodytarum]